MNYGNIKECDIADGPGVRVSLFVSGCRHHCKGCFNEETWDFGFGQHYTEETEAEILRLLFVIIGTSGIVLSCLFMSEESKPVAMTVI